MMENETAKLENPPISRSSSCAYPKWARSAASLASPALEPAFLEIDVFTQLFADRLLQQILQRVSGLHVDKRILHNVPIELVALVVGRHPDLAHRRIGADDEFGRRILEFHAQRACIEIDFESVIVGSGDQIPVERG